MDVFLKLKFILMVLNSNLAPLLPVPFIFDPRPVKIYVKIPHAPCAILRPKSPSTLMSLKSALKKAICFSKLSRTFPNKSFPEFTTKPVAPSTQRATTVALIMVLLHGRL